MKVKYLGDDTILYTHGQIYEAEIEQSGYSVLANCGTHFWEPADRFVPINPIEEKKQQISDARNSLKKLEKELAEMTLPKVGQRYLNKTGIKYVVCECNSLFALVSYEGCYEGCNRGKTYGGKFHDNVANIFCDCKDLFTLIED